MITIVLTTHEIINITSSDNINLTFSDILLIQNLLFTDKSLRLFESWLPICLTAISDEGHLQMYCNFFNENFGVVFITESRENEYYKKFGEQSRELYKVNKIS